MPLLIPPKKVKRIKKVAAVVCKLLSDVVPLLIAGFSFGCHVPYWWHSITGNSLLSEFSTAFSTLGSWLMASHFRYNPLIIACFVFTRRFHLTVSSRKSGKSLVTQMRTKFVYSEPRSTTSHYFANWYVAAMPTTLSNSNSFCPHISSHSLFTSIRSLKSKVSLISR